MYGTIFCQSIDIYVCIEVDRYMMTNLSTYFKILKYTPKEHQSTSSYNKRLSDSIESTHNILDLQYIDKLGVYISKSTKKTGGVETPDPYEVKAVYFV